MRRTLLIAASTLALALPVQGISQQGTRTGQAPYGMTSYGLAGAYLAARQAIRSYDYDVAVTYFDRAIEIAPNHPELLERATVAHFSLGNAAAAVRLARVLRQDNFAPSQIANLVMAAELGATGTFDPLLRILDSETGVGLISTDLLRGWALLGAGDAAGADLAFAQLAEERSIRPFALYHRALARNVAGDDAGALEILNTGGLGGLERARRTIRLRAELMARTGDMAGARGLLTPFAGLRPPDPAIAALLRQIDAGGDLPPSDITTVAHGMAEVFLTLAEALSTEANPDFLLLYIRAAIHLRPDLTDALLFGAELLEDLGQYDLAVDTYRLVPPSDPAFVEAEIGRATALREAGQTEAAIAVLETAAAQYPARPEIHSALGDMLRWSEAYTAATAAYNTALQEVDPDAPETWFLHYVRGITYERANDWPRAEADFRRALELNPGQPQVLNYLGYSLVQKGIKLDEALVMIQQAVEAAPGSGYIIDSLGWVLYRLGRYEEALPHMFRAAELMPIGPILSDHLRDVLWANDRKREARFQWNRALSFVGYGTAAEEVDADRIRRKLEIGLDAVLAEDGEPPLIPAETR